jgi:hypothetical protein
LQLLLRRGLKYARSGCQNNIGVVAVVGRKQYAKLVKISQFVYHIEESANFEYIKSIARSFLRSKTKTLLNCGIF